MKINQLLNLWKTQSENPVAQESFTIMLPQNVAAKIMALNEMFPGRSQEQIISELLASAIDEIEEGFPYVEGPKVIQRDDHGDPIYEDIGHTPLFEKLSQKHLEKLRNQSKA